METMEILTVATTFFAAVAAILGMRIALIEIRDNTDEFINDLHRQGKWQKYAAAANLTAAAILMVAQCLVLLKDY